jgi:hypothetical protein
MKKKILVGAIISASILASTQVLAQEYYFRMPVGGSSSSSSGAWNQAGETNGSCDAGYTSISGTCYVNEYDENSTSAPSSVIDDLVNNNACETQYTFSDATGTKTCSLDGSEPEGSSLTWVEFFDNFGSEENVTPPSKTSGDYNFEEGFTIESFIETWDNVNETMVPHSFSIEENIPSQLYSVSTFGDIDIRTNESYSGFDQFTNLTHGNSITFMGAFDTVVDNITGFRNMEVVSDIYIDGNINYVDLSSLTQSDSILFSFDDDLNNSRVFNFDVSNLVTVGSLEVYGPYVDWRSADQRIADITYQSLETVDWFTHYGNAEGISLPSLQNVTSGIDIHGPESIYAPIITNIPSISVAAYEEDISLVDFSSLETVSGDIYIYSDNQTSRYETIEEVNLSSLQSVNNLQIDGKVNNYNNFDQLTSANSIEIWGNSLGNLPTFNSMTHITYMDIYDRDYFTVDSFNIIPNVTTVDYLEIGVDLNDVTGIENIDLSAGGEVCIMDYADIAVKPDPSSTFIQTGVNVNNYSKDYGDFTCFTG